MRLGYLIFLGKKERHSLYMNKVKAYQKIIDFMLVIKIFKNIISVVIIFLNINIKKFMQQAID
ncbi:hypothetical protein H4F33_16975 [Pectobacterium brasiliense]|uniref:Uncharacterized protein n=1 Tax=Pectobacterium brasiliense TaxID=180957 RepID=A0AAE2WJ73_9GAMM|nr:hypothetical protein [Pectobacterium brasiliense]MBA0217649.1 hypothetical protein [Pectobacterium brasiliense]MBN3053441.1 hypothetical protein [Pectobacterium brasiliense]MBN3073770.1 hypothetical protein [Pectobacterium brasiliense]MBN3171476.1 hypothetical protein [Pectobacterium brasiliense]